MTNDHLELANDRQAQLRAEAERRRLVSPTNAPGLLQRLAAVASRINGLAFPAMDVAPRSVFPATH
jgi:hypothetical protein